jgi:serine/threonine protein kinase
MRSKEVTLVDAKADISVDLEDSDRPTDPDGIARERSMALLGQVISERYRIDELLGTGGMGAVYRGYHLLLKKQVAIKVLHPNVKNLPEFVARFQREAIAGAHVVHPNVAAATDLGKLADGSYFLVLEYVAGETLHDLIHRERLPAVRAVHIARQIAAALAAAHAMGIVHRDLKPSNVMLVEGHQDLAKLIDFGLARVPVDQVVGDPAQAGTSPGRARLTGMGVIFGTMAYLAPEAAQGMDCVDERADLYALGIILYQMLSGRHPFDAVKSSALFAQQRFQQPPPLDEVARRADLPPALTAIVMRLLAKDPAERHASSLELIAALDALGLALPEHAPDPVSAPTVTLRPGAPVVNSAAVTQLRRNARSPRRTRRVAPRRSLPLALTLAAFAIVTVTGMYLWDKGASTHPAAAATEQTTPAPVPPPSGDSVAR